MLRTLSLVGIDTSSIFNPHPGYVSIIDGDTQGRTHSLDGYRSKSSKR